MGPPRAGLVLSFQGHGTTGFSGSWDHPSFGTAGSKSSDRSHVNRPTLGAPMRSVAQEVSVSFRELTMIEVREVIRRWQAKQSLREVARETGLDRKTVRRYV